MEFAKKHGFDKENQDHPERRKQNENRQSQEETLDDDSQDLNKKQFNKRNCNSEASCKTYCEEHPDECPGFQGFTKATDASGQSSPSLMQKSQGSYVGPTGCRNEGECKNWCNDHPDSCPGFKEGKTREENAKHEYESRKKDRENTQEMKKRELEQNRETMQKNYEYRPPATSTGGSDGGTQHYPTTGAQPTYQNQPSSGSYAPLPTQQTAPQQ